MSLLHRQIQRLDPQRKVLFAVLDWGLGHATRSSVVIEALVDAGHEVILASDGQAAAYLLELFPQLTMELLPSYDIHYRYPSMVVNMAMQAPKLWSTMRAEHRMVAQLVKRYDVDLIISDNRYGVHAEQVHSILLTHQTQIMANSAVQRSVAGLILRRWIGPFDEVWVPDEVGGRLSGELSAGRLSKPMQWVGFLTRMQRQQVAEDIDVLALLSGPEPQRTRLEQALIPILESYSGQRLLISGVMDDEYSISGRVPHRPYVVGDELNALLARAKRVICRSGYSTLMDLEELSKKAILIPTPGQVEQEYLARRLAEHPNYTVVEQRDLQRLEF